MGFLATAAQAEVLNGGAPQQGNQCFSFTSPDQGRDSRYGIWTACPKPAAAVVTPAHRTRKHHASR